MNLSTNHTMPFMDRYLINADIINVTQDNDSFAFGNSTLEGFYNDTNVTSPVLPSQASSMTFKVLVKVVYLVGILGNAVAIVALRMGERRVRNRKHLLLLTSLAANDLVALVGMSGMMVVGEYLPELSGTRGFCAMRVVLRIFGVSSGCIAVTMAMERYVALTRPFFYQKQVTYCVIWTALLVSWLLAAVVVCAPVYGLGLYYDDLNRVCVRYRLAIEPIDFGYAIFYVTFGTALCIVLVYCNVAVICALYAVTAPRAGGAPLVRRVSRSSCRQRGARGSHAPPALLHNAATAEEVAFSRLMAMLSVFFMMCWLPQMITSALYLGLGEGHWVRLVPLARVSDVLMLLNYVLNPVLYVPMLGRRPLAALCRSLAACFKRGHKTSTESMSLKNSCCVQETIVISDSSGAAELRPLRPAAGAAGGSQRGFTLTR